LKYLARVKFTGRHRKCIVTIRLVLGLRLVRVSSRVRVMARAKVRVSVLVRVSIRTNWVVNFALPASNLHSSQIFIEM